MTPIVAATKMSASGAAISRRGTSSGTMLWVAVLPRMILLDPGSLAVEAISQGRIRHRATDAPARGLP